jgi:oxygen-dependent protoporphyrinogen oxidase
LSAGARIAIVGGGIAGLAAAWELRHEAEVTVFEPGTLGGKIRTSEFDGHLVDEGPDAFLTRVPAALDLCDELGLSGELVAPAAGRTLLWVNGRCRRLPEGLVLGVPKRLVPIATSGLLSARGMIRAAGDLILPASPSPGDVSVGDLIGRRFGAEVAHRLVEPLVGGIHAAPIDDLSSAAVVPQLLAAARRSRSLLRALKAQAAGPGGGVDGGPMFLTPRTGLGRLVERLTEELAAAGVTVEERAIGHVEPLSGGGVSLDGEAFGGVVLAVGANEAARLLGALAPADLSATTTSVALVTMAFAASDLPVPDGINGILVPPGEGRLMTALSFGSNKWPQWAQPGRVVVRVSSGRHGDGRSEAMDDQALVGALARELGEALGVPGATPAAWRVSRWPNAFPLYRVGHLERVAAVTATLAASAPGVTLAGGSYHGAGLPACIASGRRAARSLLTRSSAPAQSG